MMSARHSHELLGRPHGHLLAQIGLDNQVRHLPNLDMRPDHLPENFVAVNNVDLVANPLLKKFCGSVNRQPERVGRAGRCVAHSKFPRTRTAPVEWWRHFLSAGQFGSFQTLHKHNLSANRKILFRCSAVGQMTRHNAANLRCGA